MMIQLTHCTHCSKPLTNHPLYASAGAMYCKTHGDFFIYRERGKEPRIVFRPFVPARRRVKKPPVFVQLKKPTTTRTSKTGRPAYMIRCEQSGVVYESLNQASQLLSISQSDLSRHLRGLRRHVRGYTFVRLEYDNLGELVEVPRPLKIKPSKRASIAIRCDQTQRVFESIHEAARVLNIGRGNIYSHLLGMRNRQHVGGYTFTKVTS